MESTYTRTQIAVESQAVAILWNGAKGCLRGIAAFLTEGARGEDFSSQFAPCSGQFAALPRSQQNRMLDRGYRP